MRYDIGELADGAGFHGARPASAATGGPESTLGCVGVDEDEDDYEDSPNWLDEYDVRRWNSATRSYEIKEGYGQVGEKLLGLEQSAGHFEDFLEDTFGDHATITATKAGFDIAFYDHD